MENIKDNAFLNNEIFFKDLGLCDECQNLYIEKNENKEKYCCLETNIEIKDNSIQNCMMVRKY